MSLETCFAAGGSTRSSSEWLAGRNLSCRTLRQAGLRLCNSIRKRAHPRYRSLIAMSRFDIHRVARHLTHHPRWVIRAVQLAIFAAAAVLAFLLRFDFTVPAQYRPHLLAGICVFVPVKIFAFYFFKMDRGWWRYASIRDVARLGLANLVGSVLGC